MDAAWIEMTRMTARTMAAHDRERAVAERREMMPPGSALPLGRYARPLLIDRKGNADGTGHR